MMSVLCNRKQIQIMFSKGAPESILPRCTHIMCNNDGSTIRLTPEIRSEIDSKFYRSGLFSCFLVGIRCTCYICIHIGSLKALIMNML